MILSVLHYFYRPGFRRREACSLGYFSTFQSNFYLNLAGDWHAISAVTISLITQVIVSFMGGGVSGNRLVLLPQHKPSLLNQYTGRYNSSLNQYTGGRLQDYISHQVFRCSPPRRSQALKAEGWWSTARKVPCWQPT